jgi:hypothetical protein
MSISAEIPIKTPTGYERTLVTCVLNSRPKRVTLPDAVLTQFVILKMSIIVLETCRGM